MVLIKHIMYKHVQSSKHFVWSNVNHKASDMAWGSVRFPVLGPVRLNTKNLIWDRLYIDD